MFLSSSLEQFKDVRRTLQNWRDVIINLFIIIDDCLTISKKNEISMPSRLSNGPIEGINSIIEQVKINGKGYTAFKRFRLRIIYVINKAFVFKGN